MLQLKEEYIKIIIESIEKKEKIKYLYLCGSLSYGCINPHDIDILCIVDSDLKNVGDIFKHFCFDGIGIDVWIRSESELFAKPTMLWAQCKAVENNNFLYCPNRLLINSIDWNKCRKECLCASYNYLLAMLKKRMEQTYAPNFFKQSYHVWATLYYDKNNGQDFLPEQKEMLQKIHDMKWELPIEDIITCRNELEEILLKEGWFKEELI